MVKAQLTGGIPMVNQQCWDGYPAVDKVSSGSEPGVEKCF